MAKLIQEFRYVVSATSTTSIPTSSQVLCTVTASKAIPKLLGNEIIAVRLLSSSATESQNTGIVQSANMSVLSGSLGVSQPAFNSNPLGRVNRAAFQAANRFHAEDIGLGLDCDVNLNVLVSNGSGTLTLSVVLGMQVEVIRRQYDEPVYDH